MLMGAGSTNPKYPIMEVAISLTDYRDLANGHERRQAGDIVSVRLPLGYIGKKEGHDYMWLLMEGLEYSDWSLLKSSETEPLDDTASSDIPKVQYAKNRFCIPFRRLVQVFPAFNEARARNVEDFYQPFILMDQDGIADFLATMAPLNVHGLVWDKARSLYL